MQELLKLIKERQSTRTPFDPERIVSKDAIRQILEAGSWAPTAHNMQNFEIVVVDDKKLINEIRQVEFTTSETFVRENYLQLSFSEDELQKKKKGVLGTMFPKSWLQPVFVPEHIDSEEYETEGPTSERHNQLLPCPALFVMLYDPARRAPASEGDFLGIMSLGCALENMWLMASSLGISFHVVSALSGGGAENEVRRILCIPDYLVIAISFRIGYPLAPSQYLRVRRDISDFAHHNKFGNMDL